MKFVTGFFTNKERTFWVIKLMEDNYSIQC